MRVPNYRSISPPWAVRTSFKDSIGESLNAPLPFLDLRRSEAAKRRYPLPLQVDGATTVAHESDSQAHGNSQSIRISDTRQESQPNGLKVTLK